MGALSAVVGYTLKQHLRHRVYLALLIFGLILFGGSLVVSSMAVSQRVRLLLDLGLAGTEAIALIAMVFLTVSLILEEMETKTISLILAHPIPRWAYVIGRFLGTLGAVVVGMLVMAGLHLLILLLYGWGFEPFYFAAWLCILGKIVVAGVLALLLSLFSSSAPTAMAFTAFLWVLGHFTGEMAFMTEKSGSVAVSFVVWAMYHIAPDLSYFSYRDFLGSALPPGVWFGWMSLYTVCYAGVCLYLSCVLVSRKEF